MLVLKERKGIIITKAMIEDRYPKSETEEKEYLENLINLEIELNNEISANLYKKYRIMIRVHL